MDYSEVVRKFKDKEPVHSTDINGVQIFMLLHDRLIKTVRLGSTLYEVNFIPMDYGMNSMLYINLATCQDYNDANTIFKRMITLYKNHEPIYINLEEEYFEIKLEILEE